MLIVAEAEHQRQAIEAAQKHQPDVVLLDIRLPGGTGIDVARALRLHTPDARIIMLTSYDNDEYLYGALEAGASGYLLKSASDEVLIAAIRAVQRGERLITPSLMDRMIEQFTQLRRSKVRQGTGLSDEDIEVLGMIAAGASNEEIGAALNWSMASVKRKVQHIFERLGVTTRAQAAAEAVRRGLA
jgi:DNA-binding NarL/FixJ family response regulator